MAVSIKESSRIYGEMAEYIGEHTDKMPRAGNYRGLPRTRVGGHFIAEEERATVDTTAVIPLTS